MSFTDQEIRMLSAANDEHGWAPVPSGTPARFVQKICEKRAQQIGFKPPPAPNSAAADVEARRQWLLNHLANAALSEGR